MDYKKTGGGLKKTKEGLDFYNDQGERKGSAQFDNPRSLESLYRSIREECDKGYLTGPKCAHLQQIVQNRLGYEPPATERTHIPSTREITNLAQKLAQETASSRSQLVEVKFPRRAA